MKFEWDEKKNQSNIAKHGVSFEQASEIFVGPVLTNVDKRTHYGERREISIGRIERVAIIVVAHTDRSGTCRIISARPARKDERQRYEQAIQEADDAGGDGERQ